MSMFAAIDAPIQDLAKTLQKPEDQVRLFLGLFVQIPIGFFLNFFVTSPGAIRYTYSLVVGSVL
jgi:hypothetical protein